MQVNIDQYFSNLFTIRSHIRHMDRLKDDGEKQVAHYFSGYYAERKLWLEKSLAKQNEGIEEIKKGIAEILDGTIQELNVKKGGEKEASYKRLDNMAELVIDLYFSILLCLTSDGKERILPDCTKPILLRRPFLYDLKKMRKELDNSTFADKLALIRFFEKHSYEKFTSKRMTRFLSLFK